MRVEPEIAPKEKLFQTAARLFYQRGYHASGVDTIAEESGIGKMTLYRHYSSKDDLIVAYLKEYDKSFWDHFEQVTKDAPTPREKLLAVFEALQTYVQTPDCFGCPLLNVAAEYPEPGHPGHQVALEHKQAVRERFRQLAREAGAHRPRALADQLFLLMDGAYMAARTFGPQNPASSLASAAQALLDAQIQR
jgi:AcrR family transcriptional regulator